MNTVRRWLRGSLACLAAATIIPIGATRAQARSGSPPAAPAAGQQQASMAALSEANRIKDPTERLAALEKLRASNPSLAQADQFILSLLAGTWPDRLAAINEVVDRMVGRTPASASPDSRLTAILSPVNTLTSRKLLLDRCEQMVTDALAALSVDSYTESRRDLAKRMNQPEPAPATIKTGYNIIRSRGVEALGRIHIARGDTARAERTFKEAVALNPSYSVATIALVDIYNKRDDFASAEQLLKDVIAGSAGPPAPPTQTLGADGRVVMTVGSVVLGPGGASGAAAAQVALGNLYVKHGDKQKAESLFVIAIAKSPTNKAAIVSLAKLQAQRGADSIALGNFLLAAVLPGSMVAADDSAMRALYRKAKGSAADIDADLDQRYLARFPNPVKPEAYVPTEKRSTHVALLEMFTGSGCPPCVSADLAIEAAMKRYPSDAVVAVNYHENVPQPDPMVVAGGIGRKNYYSVRGVPTFNIDGALAQLGGGSREATQRTYANYIKQIDKALEAPAGASLEVSATGKGDQVSVAVQVSNLPADAKDLRLHVLLVERELRFAGENGVRFHPMVVRAAAGDSGSGIVIRKNGSTRQTFSLKSIRDDVARTLAAELTRRNPPGSTARNFAATGHAYTAIDTLQLVVVAYIQRGPYIPAATTTAAAAEVIEDSTAAHPAKPATPPAGTPGPNVLQAARADVVFGAPAKGKSGDK